MAKAEAIPAFTRSVVDDLASPDAAIKARGHKNAQLLPSYYTQPDVVIPPASLTPEQLVGHADAPTAARFLEAQKIQENAQKSVAKKEGIWEDVKSIGENYQKLPLTNKLAMSVAFAGCAATATMIGGPMGLFLGGIGLAGKLGQRVFGTMSTFMLSEALVNRTIQHQLDPKKTSTKFIKWGLTALGAAGAFFVGQQAGEFLAEKFRGLLGGAHDWAAEHLKDKYVPDADWMQPDTHDYLRSTVELDAAGHPIDVSSALPNTHDAATLALAESRGYTQATQDVIDKISDKFGVAVPQGLKILDTRVHVLNQLLHSTTSPDEAADKLKNLFTIWSHEANDFGHDLKSKLMEAGIPDGDPANVDLARFEEILKGTREQIFGRVRGTA